jgi:hypothetical protein
MEHNTTQHNTTQHKHKHKRKKLVGVITGIMAVAAVSIYSCKKEVLATDSGKSANSYNLEVAETPSNSTQRNIGGSSSCLNFLTFDDYEKAINNPTAQQQLTLSSIIQSFTTYTSYTQAHPNDTLFGDSDFTDLLNSDGVIQIAGYYFKVDPALQKVFVLPITDAAYYSDLIAQYPQSGKVTMFNTDDEVIAMIKDGAMFNTVQAEVDITDSTTTAIIQQRGFFKRLFVSIVKPVAQWVQTNIIQPIANVPNVISRTFAWNCGEQGYNKWRHADELYDHAAPYKASAFHRAWGIYFHLFGVIDGTKNNQGYAFGFIGGMGNSSHPDKGYVYYKPKCVSTITQYEKVDVGSTKYNLKTAVPYMQYNAYRGTKPLNKFYFGFYVVITYSGNYPVSPLVLIKGNM